MKIQLTAASENLKNPVFKKRVHWNIAAMILICLVFAASSARGQAIERIEVGSSFNPVGSGARSLGMGGAFIGIADDATAASWNPGGLSQLDAPEMSVVYGYLHRIEDTDSEKYPEFAGSESFSPSHLNYLSFAYPFGTGNYPMTLSLNYQKMYDFNHGWSYSLDEKDSFPTQTDYEQQGSLYALGLAYCVELKRNFALGFTLNYWGDFIIDNQWKQKYVTTTEEFWGRRINIKKQKYNFDGWNAHLGFLWKISEQLRLGGVFKTPFTADIEHHIVREENLLKLIDVNITPSDDSPKTSYKKKLRMPMSYGMGLAYRRSDTLTFALDIYRTHWEDFELEDEEGNKFSPLSNKEINQSNITATTWFRIGAEKVFIIRKYNVLISLRGGVFYDPPASEQKNDDYYGASMGLGFVFNSLSFDFAYQFRFGNNVNTAMPEDLSQDIDEHTVYSSFILYF